MWFDIVKQPKLRTSSNITTQLGSKSKPEEDDSCKRKLDEYEIKLKRMRDEIRERDVYTFVSNHFKDIPEEVACKALKILNGLKLQETNNNKLLSDSTTKEQMVIGGKRYGIKAVYSLIRNPQYTSGDKGPLDVHISMQLKISRESSLGYLRTVLNFTVMFLGTKEEAMKMVDFR